MSKIIEIRAPKTLGGESVTEGIIKIKKNIGEIVEIDDVIFEIETDKTALELTSDVSGRIVEFLVKEGNIIIPNQLLARLSVEETKKKKEENIKKECLSFKRNAPSVRNMMEKNKIYAENVKGTGLGGRITKADIVTHIGKGKDTYDSFTRLPKDREERVKMSKIRQVIAARLKASQNTAAILTTFNEIDMKNLITLRGKYKEAFEKKYEIKLGLMSLFIKASVQALKEVPEINTEVSGDEVLYKYYYDIGVAIGTDKGLVVPVIRNADQMSLAEIELTLASLAKKAREVKLQVSEMEGATFTISNGGVYGSLFSTPIINPPQSGILGMHSIQDRPVVIGNSIEIRPMMYVALSYDHRIVDGKGAVTFLAKIKNYIEDPNRLLLTV